MEIASRRVGQPISIAAAGTGRVIFGPFDLGERLDFIFLYLDSDEAVSKSGQMFSVELRKFAVVPADTATEFAADGHLLTGNGTAGTDPSLPVLGVSFALPVGFEGESAYRYLGIQITELNGDSLAGSAWCQTSRM